MKYQLFWGDLHNHCSVGLFHYSKGSLERAIDIAKSHLDFFAFTGHAHWHDMPAMPNDGHLKWQEGFDHHTDQWATTRQLIAEANEDRAFVAYPGFEWHSAEYGDRCVIFRDDDCDLVLPDNINDLAAYAREKGAMLIPHHIGYKSWLPGREANWDATDESTMPLLEVFSEHGGHERPPHSLQHSAARLGPGRSTDRRLAHSRAVGWRPFQPLYVLFPERTL